MQTSKIGMAKRVFLLNSSMMFFKPDTAGGQLTNKFSEILTLNSFHF
jgi:hypothetical protein